MSAVKGLVKTGMTIYATIQSCSPNRAHSHMCNYEHSLMSLQACVQVISVVKDLMRRDVCLHNTPL